MEQPDLSALADDVFSRLRSKLSSLESFRRVPPRAIILTDWTVSYPQAWTTFSFAATYLGWHMNARPVSLVLDPASVTPMGQTIHDSFGYAGQLVLLEYIRNATSQDDVAVMNSEMADWPKEGPALRERILGLTFEGLPVGDLVYDAHLRGTGRPSIDLFDESVRNDVILAFLFYKGAQRLLDDWDVKAFITAHRIYYQLGMLARVALARGITVIESGAVNPWRVKHYRGFLEAMDDPLRLAPDELDRVLTRERETALTYGKQYMAERLTGAAQRHGTEDTVGAYGNTRRIYDKAALCERLGWDPERPIVAVMPHVFVEGPHFGKNLYDDFYHWIAETLRIAAGNDKIQWLIKGHPDAKYFEDLVNSRPTAESADATLRRLLAPYADCPHIALAPDDLNTGSLPPLVKAVITLYGSVGIEFSTIGIPAIIAAEACYTGHGFAVECRTRAEYEHRLATLHDIAPLSPIQQERALAFFYLMYVKSRPTCSALPPLSPLDWWSPRQDQKMLEGMSERLDRYEPREDPLYRRLGLMLRHGYSSAFDFDDIVPPDDSGP